MGIRRRIEITAFRRSSIVFSAQPGHGSNGCSIPKSKPAEPNSTVESQAGEIDLTPARTTSGAVARSPELTLLITALVENDGDSGRAANQLGLSHGDFISKLCGFSFSDK